MVRATMVTSVLLNTERLTIREFSRGDLGAFQAISSDPTVARHLAFGPTSREESRALIDFAMSSRREAPRLQYALALVEQTTGELIGSCGLALAAEQPRVAEVYFALRPSSWGRGYATEALKAIISFGVDTLKLHRIWGQAMIANQAAALVMRKAGMSHEGMIRKAISKGGRWEDAFQYSILESDPRESHSATEHRTRT